MAGKRRKKTRARKVERKAKTPALPIGVTPERAAKGDIVFGDWLIDAGIVRNAEGEVVHVDPHDPASPPRVQHDQVKTWRRADRLVALYRSELITREQMNAGQKLSREAERAGMLGFKCSLAGIKVDVSTAARGFRDEALDAAWAQQSVERAMAMLGGSSSLLGGVVWLVAVQGLSLRDLKKGTTWCGRPVDNEQAMGVLRAGLDILARYWLRPPVAKAA